jgi:hypothetical protein
MIQIFFMGPPRTGGAYWYARTKSTGAGKRDGDGTETSARARGPGIPSNPCLDVDGLRVPLREVRVPLREADLGDEQTRVPLREVRVPLREVRVPLREADLGDEQTRVPLREERVSLRETHLGDEQTRVPLREERVPLRETHLGDEQAHVPLREERVPLRETHLGDEQARVPSRSRSSATRWVGSPRPTLSGEDLWASWAGIGPRDFHGEVGGLLGMREPRARDAGDGLDLNVGHQDAVQHRRAIRLLVELRITAPSASG